MKIDYPNQKRTSPEAFARHLKKINSIYGI
jgi:hypothetical protein